MTTAPAEINIELVRGDSDDIVVTVTDDADTPVEINLSTAVDGTVGRPAIVRFAVKRDTHAGAVALIEKTSHDEDEIEVLDQSDDDTVGQVLIKLDKPDTSGVPAGIYQWDLEVTRQDTVRAGAGVGTIEVEAGSATVTGTGTRFLLAKVGDVLQVLTGANAGRAALITSLLGDESAVVDLDFPDDDAAATIEIRRGRSKTAALGRFTLVQDVVS